MLPWGPARSGNILACAPACLTYGHAADFHRCGGQARTLVGVMLQCKLPMSSLQLCIARVAVNAKDLIVASAIRLLLASKSCLCSRKAPAEAAATEGKAATTKHLSCSAIDSIQRWAGKQSSENLTLNPQPGSLR